MRLRRRTILVAVVAGIATAGCPPPVASATAGDGLLSILVMGDSYSAGNGAGSYYGAKGCWRSAHNYGREYQRIVEAAPYRQKAFVRTVACSGDVTAAFATGKSGRPRQLDAVNGGYDLILLTIGGNDLKFADIVKYCLIAKSRDGANCGSLLTDAEVMLAQNTLRKRLDKVLSAVQAKADPSATIALLGYPYLEGDPSYTLRSGHGGHTFIKVGRRLRKLEDTGDDQQQAAVDALDKPGAAKVLFVKTKALFAGPPNHELYANRNNSHRWFIQPFVGDGAVGTWYHPNPTGWKEEAKLLARDGGVPTHDPTLTLAGTYTQITAAHEGSFMCGLRTDATVACWGDKTHFSAVEMTPPSGPFTYLATGGHQTCGLRPDATITCWGDDTWGQATPPAGTFTQLAAFVSSTCGLRTDATVTCWGLNVPGVFTPPGGTFTQLSAGGVHYCGLRPDGTATCWGGDRYGAATPPDGLFTSLAAGGFHTCGLRPDATATCWGDNRFGEATPPSGTFTQLTAQLYSTCGLRTDGPAVCWGSTDGTPPAGKLTQLTAGDGYVCGLRADSTVACWGRVENIPG